MIVLSVLNGGLGNQLFQYAAASALAVEHAAELRLLFHCDPGDTPRKYMLDRLNVDASLADAAWLRDIGYPAPRWQRLLAGLLPAGRARCQEHDERQFRYQPLVPRGEVFVLRGFFQSQRYFAAHAAALRVAFRPVAEPGPCNAALLDEIGSGTAVAVHVRRGDYAGNAATRAYHGVLDEAYYHRALAALAPVVRDAAYFVFSDDIAWARARLTIPAPVTYVAHNAAHPEQDLRLMAACRHFVIANSSFSWWGAWLSRHPGKTVVAPRRWFVGGPRDTEDLYPPDWLRV